MGLEEPAVGLGLDLGQLDLARRDPQINQGLRTAVEMPSAPSKTSCPMTCCIQVVPDLA